MKKYLVIGNPINHSLSPKLQNWWLKENNINATYDKIKLEDHEIKNFIQTIKEQKIAGCNVTVPFKKTVIPFLDKLSPEAEHTQSVNTITFENGDLVGHNTDIAGFSTAVLKPAISVLCPTKSPFSKVIVFTDWVCSASGLNLSKKGITVFLKGTVTLQPAIFCSLIV